MRLMHEITHVRSKTPRELELERQLRNTLAALRDLDDGYPWRELHIDLGTMLAEAEQLGIELED